MCRALWMCRLARAGSLGGQGLGPSSPSATAGCSPTRHVAWARLAWVSCQAQAPLGKAVVGSGVGAHAHTGRGEPVGAARLIHKAF